MCDICKDVELIRWEQLSLDSSHVVLFEAHRCLCGYRLVEVFVMEAAVSDGS